jgi:hypothetical protein
MQSTRTCAPQRAAALQVGMMVLFLSFSPAHAACDFGVVKQQIDTILDNDVEKGAKFRREVISGADSIAVMEALVSTDMADKIDVCRFEVGEYLTKRGFPPFH